MRRRVLFQALAALAAGCKPAAQPRVGADPARLGGPFTLVDTHGRTFTDADLKGMPYVMFFGFTYCPEVCPTTLTALTAEMKALGPDADKLKVIYVTIDPERDTPAQMREYLTMFDPRIIGLTGTPVQVAQIAKAYNVYYMKTQLPGGSYTMDHTAGIYLVRRDGSFVTLMNYQTAPKDAVDELRQLVRS